MLNYGQQSAQQLVPGKRHNSICNSTINTSKKTTRTTMTRTITTGLTEHMEDVAEDMDVATANVEEDSAAPRVATEVATNVNRKEENLAGDTVEIVEDIKEDLVKRNATSATNLDAGQTNIPWRSVNRHMPNSANMPSTQWTMRLHHSFSKAFSLNSKE